VYFEAPGKILAAELLSATSFYDGGLYFPTDGSSEIYPFVLQRNQPRFLALPSDFRYGLDERQGARRTSRKTLQ
jgi:hypothetical protein